MLHLPLRAEVIRGFRARLAGLEPSQLISTSAFLIAIIGLADYLTGYYLSLGLFYVAPIALASWYISRRTGALASGLSALVWLVANAYAAPAGTSATILAWNTMIRFGFFVIIASLVAAVRSAHVRERMLARSDPLTGLMNGRAFRESADRELMRAIRTGNPLTLLYLDLDNFKRVNDRRGHTAGDALLVAFARLLENAVRSTDLVCRIGGDEFVVLLPDTTERQGSVVAAKIEKAIQGDPRFARDGVSVSTGGATTNDERSSVEELVARADEAMYEAKAARPIAVNQIR